MTMPAIKVSGEGPVDAGETILLHGDTSKVPVALQREADRDWLSEAEMAVQISAKS